MTSEQFSQIAPTIPVDPGIYKYFDEQDELVYVGKAKNLRKRVSSYFTKTFTTYKTYELVQRIRRIEFMNLPKAISGKIRRVDLRTRENACEPDALTHQYRDR